MGLQEWCDSQILRACLKLHDTTRPGRSHHDTIRSLSICLRQLGWFPCIIVLCVHGDVVSVGFILILGSVVCVGLNVHFLDVVACA